MNVSIANPIASAQDSRHVLIGAVDLGGASRNCDGEFIAAAEENPGR